MEEVARGRRRVARHGDRAVRRRAAHRGDLPHDREHPRHGHAAADRVRAQELGRPPVPYTWLATGSVGRFEPFPSSDVDCASHGTGPDDDRSCGQPSRARRACARSASVPCGFPPDTNGAVATNPLFARSVGGVGARGQRPGSSTPTATADCCCSPWSWRAIRSGASTGAAEHLAAVFAHAPEPRSGCCKGWPPPRCGASADRVLPQPRAQLERRAQGGARHQASRAGPDRGAGALERACSPA